MMNNYKLSEGEYTKKRLSDEDMWDAFEWLFSKESSHDTSYKYIFLKSILNCLEVKDSMGRLTFDVIFKEFTIISWNLIVIYKLNQKKRQDDGRITFLEKDILAMVDKTSPRIRFEELYEDEQNDVCRDILRDCRTYVVGALYGDTLGYLYSFSKKEGWIRINPQMEDFLIKNKQLIEKLNYYKWAEFYKKKNDSNREDELWNLIGQSFARKGETVYQAILAYEFDRTGGLNTIVNPVNTLELLFEAEEKEQVLNDDEYTNAEVESELYKDFSSMKEYLNDPILLLSKLKEAKGIA